MEMKIITLEQLRKRTNFLLELYSKTENEKIYQMYVKASQRYALCVELGADGFVPTKNIKQG